MGSSLYYLKGNTTARASDYKGIKLSQLSLRGNLSRSIHTLCDQFFFKLLMGFAFLVVVILTNTGYLVSFKTLEQV